MNFIDSNNKRLLNIASPQSDYDGANKLYVDSVVQNITLLPGDGLILTGNTLSVNTSLPHLTAVGNLSVGTWTADTVSVHYGGTGTTSFSTNKLVIGNGTNPLQTLSSVILDDNIFNITTTTKLSNTSNAVNSTSGGCLTVSGGVSIAKDLIIGGNMNVSNATINNLSIPGTTNFNNIQALSSSFTNVSSTNLLATNSTLNNLTLSSIISTSGNFYNVTISNTYITNATIGQLMTSNVTTSNLRFINGIGSNLNITNFTGTNTTLSGSSISSSVITNSTGSNLFITTFTSSNAFINNATVNNSLLSNLTAGSSSLTNVTNINLTSSNLYCINNNISNLTCSNSIINNITSTNIYTTNLSTSNINNSNLNSNNATVSNLNNLYSTTASAYINNLTCPNTFLTNITCTNAVFTNISTTNISTNSGNFYNLQSSSASINNLNSNSITTGSIITNDIVSTNTTLNNINTTNITTGSIIALSLSSNAISSNYLTSGSIVSNIISSSNINSFNLTSANLTTLNIDSTTVNSILVNTTYLSSTFNTISNIKSSNITTTNLHSQNINSSISNFVNSNITNASLQLCNINFSSISNLVVSGDSIFKRQVTLGGNNFNSKTSFSSGALLTVNPYNFTDNTSTSGNVQWISSYFATPTLSAQSPITTTKAATVYISGKPLAGPNQTITNSTNLALGYVNNTQGTNLTGQIMFERYDGNWFTSMYVDNTNQFIINNASADSGSTSGSAGIGIYVQQNNPITFASIPNASNITPSGFIQFTQNISTFYSTTESTNLTTASVVFNGGISINKGLSAQRATIGNLITTNISSGSLTLNNITTNNINTINITSSNINSSNMNVGNITSSNINIDNITSNNINVGTIYSGAGILGPTLLLQQHYIDTTVDSLTSLTSSNTILFIEPGNPGIYGAIGNNLGFGSGMLSNASNDTISWNYARLIIRGVSLNTFTSGSSINIQPIIVQGNSGIINTQSNFTVTDSGSDYGYSTWISPWFSTNTINTLQSLGIQLLSITTGNLTTFGNVRIGPSYLQFKA